ncbi:anthranilate phosphoribosyltransferase [Sphingomonas sp. URHD0057]|uniref:anthranilate phosphoribosyltransferase n=1 Tax=Sphingomonas sp. URHD0057 TaxID=1380389 RepID=UPI0012DF0891|nr:anthranilate phosphoribosyltransferase [Sphingomonas sp. URHD0057]
MSHILSFARDSVAAPAPADPAAEAPIMRLLDGENLDRAEARELFARIVEGSLSDPLMAAAFVALRVKGETADELIGAAEALRSAARRFPSPATLFADSCGTGGDFSGSINVSTAAGLVAAACGLPVVKHGNRSFTSQCGSADVLEALGARLDLSPLESREIFDQTGFCFLLAPYYHPGIAHAGPVRRALKVRTIMNLLGPCLNPAQPKVQLLGVADPKLLRPIAETLRALGVERALVVHGSGLDEIAPHGVTQAVSLADGDLEDLEITPEQAGLARQAVRQIAGGSPADNARRLTDIVAGVGGTADISVVALNAGALLMTAGKVADLKDGVGCAMEAMRSRRALRVLDAFVEASRG